jgi:hypothetical protein
VPELGESAIRWTSPLRADTYREYRDGEFLDHIGRSGDLSSLTAFWPARGPVWDGLARVQLEDGSDGVLLVEAKSYPAELYGSGCRAGEVSRPLIERSLDMTRRRLSATSPLSEWTGPLYQTANRLAHLVWLRDERGVPAWLLHVLFTDDPHRRTTEDRWEAEMRLVNERLGLPPTVDGAVHVLLPALDV